MAETTIVYTDGGCIGNPGPGGWAWAIEDGAFGSGREPRTTNQRMEIRAVIEALANIPGKVEVVSDSQYVVNCFRDHWWEGWIARGWRTTARKPVANRDLWEPLINTYRERGQAENIQFRWVRGHDGDKMNEYVDSLANGAAREQAALGDFDDYVESDDETTSGDGPTNEQGQLQWP